MDEQTEMQQGAEVESASEPDAVSTDELMALLKAPFDPSEVEWRVGSTTGDKKRGMVFAYAKRLAYTRRLDDVLGPLNWRNEYTKFDDTMICTLSIRVDGEWYSKADGAGATEIEGEKGAITDAFKRACTQWGPGRYLYELESPWVEIIPAGKKSHKIKPSEFTRLNDLLVLNAKKARDGVTPARKQAKPEPEPEPTNGKATALAEEPQDETPNAEPTTYPDIFDVCCDQALNGQVDVVNWLKRQGDFPSLNTVPQDVMHKMYIEFVGKVPAQEEVSHG